MATSTPISIFLVEPLNKKAHKAKLVYADNETNARTAAAKSNGGNDLYLNGGMSICIPVEYDMVKMDSQTDTVTINYRDVIYHLNKNTASDLISDSIF